MFTFTTLSLAIINNIVLMGLLWIVFTIWQVHAQLSSKQLFKLAIGFQFSGSIIFILNLFNTQLFNFIRINHFEIFTSSAGYHFTLLSAMPYLGVTYFVILAILIIRMAIQFYKLQQLKLKSDFSKSADWQENLNIKKDYFPANLKIGTSLYIDSPIAFGYFEPVILLPVSICNHLNSEELKYILLHELAHILRQDYLINLFTTTSKIILWFNPFVYLLNNAIELHREMACDEFVLAQKVSPLSYSKALLNLAHTNSQNNIHLSIGALGSNNELLFRIKQINKMPFRYMGSKLLLILGSLTILVCSIHFLKESRPVVSYTLKRTNFYKYQNNAQAYTTKVVQTKQSEKVIGTTIKHNAKPTEAYKRNIVAAAEFEHQLVTPAISYNTILDETKQWIKAHQNGIQLVAYNESKDSADNILAERLLMSSIITNYQLKRALLAQKLGKVANANEAADYILNSKEWAEMVQYEKWAHEFLQRNQ